MLVRAQAADAAAATATAGDRSIIHFLSLGLWQCKALSNAPCMHYLLWRRHKEREKA